MATQNLLLTRLPSAVYERIKPRLERVDLDSGQRLFEIGEPVRYAYFPTGGLLSLETTAVDGESLELATVGSEGMIGVPILLQDDTAPHRVAVHAGASAFRIRRHALLDELRQGAALRDALLSYAAIHLREISDAALCHYAHTVLERVCRRILTAADRLEAQTLEMTHERLAQALGVTRAAIGLALIELERADALWSHRGRLMLRKRPMLESTACDCYHTWRDRVQRVATPGSLDLCAAPSRDVRP